ncbi:SIMPL domain-containing protein [Derxia gummosa]|uniref:SIMPL domain-containing protein n=1 Tax=Derxia gummosa DSM 723 TaxID=1121388 RepID=A0A8B6X791_9BURK|nr:SIMPL domain-containing protein [Derxia gummosa]
MNPILRPNPPRPSASRLVSRSIALMAGTLLALGCASARADAPSSPGLPAAALPGALPAGNAAVAGMPTPAQAAAPAGTIVLLRARAEAQFDNDEARVAFYAQEQGADRAQVAAAVNRRMRDATAALKAADPSAELRSTGYSTYPVNDRNGKQTGWVARQDLSLVTRNLKSLEATVARAQALVAVQSVGFGLSREARLKAEAQLFDQAFADLRARIANVSRALGRTPEQALIEQLDFAGGDEPAPPRAFAMARAASAEAVDQPSFEAGDSSQSLAFNARVRIP